MKYSEKALEYFRTPKFAGEMKDADAVGQAGNIRCGDVMKIFLKIEKGIIKDIKYLTYGCLPPKEKIVVEEGLWENIGNLSKSDVVLDAEGIKTKIEQTFNHDHNGEMLKFIPFVSPYNSFSVTTEHPILCVQREKLKKSRVSSKSWLRVNHDELLSTNPCYIKAANLKKGDYLVFSYNREIKDKRSYTVPFLRLLGYYLAEGYFSAAGSTVAFSFHKNEEKYISEVKRLIKEVTGKEAKFRVRGNVGEVYFNSREWVRKFLELAGKLARKKSLSKTIMLLPPKKQMQLIETYLNGDGDVHYRRKNNTPMYRLATTSENLAIQLQQILARNNIFASISIQKQTDSVIDGRLISGSDLFIVSYKLERKHKFVHSAKGYFLVPIRNIITENYRGKVYNFEVASKSHSYLAKGFVVHNCIGAIAASEAMCKLVKGKKIEDALKVTHKDIVKELEGMPVMKVHCSVLGRQALEKAIENYRKKR